MSKTYVLLLVFAFPTSLGWNQSTFAQQPESDEQAERDQLSDNLFTDCQDSLLLESFPVLRSLIDLLGQLIDLLNQANQIVNGGGPMIDPGTIDLGSLDPGTIDPGTFDPGTIDPGTIDPGTFAPGTIAPSTAEPGGFGEGPVPSVP